MRQHGPTKQDASQAKVNNDLKLDINDQQRFIFKKKQRVQEVFLFTKYEEGRPEDTKENGCKSEDDGEKKSLRF